MKKIVLIILGVVVFSSLFAQENKDGKMQDEILYLNNGVMLRKGSTLRLNGPLGDDSRFKYVHHAPSNMFDEVKGVLDKPAEPYYATKEVTVRRIRYVGDKKEGTEGKWIVRLRTSGTEDFLCDIVPALNLGEVSPMQVTHVTPPATPAQVTEAHTQPAEIAAEPAKAPAIGVADELLKLKMLMDEGVITKEEFEAQKKKLLNQ